MTTNKPNLSGPARQGEIYFKYAAAAAAFPVIIPNYTVTFPDTGTSASNPIIIRGVPDAIPIQKTDGAGKTTTIMYKPPMYKQ